MTKQLESLEAEQSIIRMSERCEAEELEKIGQLATQIPDNIELGQE